MKKDFEKAYKELANTEVPDLWDRIEAGLSEKSAPAETKAEKNKKTAPVNKKTKIAVFMRKYSALAAAIVCAVILIPTMIVMKKSDSKFMSESATEPAFTTESAYCDEAVAEEAKAEEALSERMEEASAAETAAEEPEMERKEEAEESKVESSMAAAEAFSQEESASGAVKESAKADSAMNDAVCEDAAPEDYNKQNVSELKNIVVKVKKAEEKPLENEAEEAGVLYTAVVKRNPSGLPKEGEEIQIFIPVVSSVALVEDGTFELDLALSEREENVYTVTGYHGEVKE